MANIAALAGRVMVDERHFYLQTAIIITWIYKKKALYLALIHLSLSAATQTLTGPTFSECFNDATFCKHGA